MLDGNPAVSGPMSARLDEERRVGGVGAQEFGAQPVDEQQRHRPRARQREGARLIRPGRRARRSAAGSTSASERLAVLGHDGSVHPAVCLLGPSRTDRGGDSVRKRGLAVVGTGTRRRGNGDSPSPKWRLAAPGWRPSVRGVSAGPDRTAAAHGTTVALDAPRPRARRRRGAARRVAAAHVAPVARRGRRAGRPAAHRHRRHVGRARPPPARRRDRASGRRARRRRPRPSEVTVVVPVKDRTDGLARLLASLAADRGRRDRRRRRLGRPRRGAGRRRGARGPAVLRHPTPRGPAAARNAGLAAATTPLVAFLDSDVRAEPGWLEPLLAHLADPAVGLVAPRIVALPRRCSGLAGPLRGRAVVAGPRPGPGRRSCRAPGSPTSPARRCSSAATRVGAGFDEDMHVAEDVDLVLRLHAAGWRLRYEPRPASRTTTAPTLARGGCARRTTAPGRPRSRCATAARCRRWCSALGGGVAGALLLARRPRRGGGGVAGRRVPPRPASSPALPHPRLDRRPDHRARRRRVRPRRPPTPSPGTTGRCGAGLRVCSRRARGTVAAVALAEGVLDWLRHRAGPERPGLLGYLVPTASTTSPTAPACGGVPLQHRTLAPLRPVGPHFDAPG